MPSFLKQSVIAATSLGLSVGIIAFADPANAATRPIEVTDRGVLVQVSDLNLHSAAGRETAKRRIRGAADLACHSHDPRDLQAMRCRDDAVGAASQYLDTMVAAR